MKLLRGLALGMAASLAFSAVPVYASEDVITLLQYPLERTVNSDTRVLTMEEAFGLARRNNSSIEALNDTLTFIWQQRRSVAIDYDNAWRLGMGMQDLNAELAGRGLRSIDMSIANAPIQTRVLETTNHYLVLNSVNTLQGMEVDLLLLRESINLQMVALRHVELRNNLGVASDADVIAARQDLAESRARLRSLEIELDGQRAALNYLLGLPNSTDVHIEHVADLTPRNISAKVRNINHFADARTNIDPTIAILRRQVELAQLNLDRFQPWVQNTIMPTLTGGPFNSQANNTDRASMVNAVNTAVRELRDGIDNMQENIRQAYGQLRQLEEQRQTLLIDLQRARDMYGNATVRLAAGDITEHELDSVRLAIIRAEADILRNALRYESLMFAFEAPFLLSGR